MEELLQRLQVLVVSNRETLNLRLQQQRILRKIRNG
jgi:hypothetical protein